MSVYDKITAQQGTDEFSPVFMVGEQLRDMIRGNHEWEDIVDKDLDVAEMSLERAEQQIHDWANKHRNGRNSVCVPPKVADDILRKFYGLPERDAAEKVQTASVQAPAATIIDLDDFFK